MNIDRGAAAFSSNGLSRDFSIQHNERIQINERHLHV